MRRTVFLDAAYAIALSASTDVHHARALELAEQIESAGTRMVTTHAVLLEIGNALSRLRYRAAAVELLLAIEADPRVEIVTMTDTLYASALRLYQQRQDKEWGLTDCVSFVVMLERGLDESLTTDNHFRQMGFKALLRQEA